MSQIADFPFCGASSAYVKEIQQGPIRQKVYHGSFVFFTDAVVFIRPPWRTRVASMGAVLGGYALGGAMGGTQGRDAGLHSLTELTSLSTEKQVERVNGRLQHVLNSYGMEKISSADIVSEFGDWSETWPNSKVVHASMKTKGFLSKSLHVTLTPNSGLKVGYDTAPYLAPTMRMVLRKAFGSRFVEG